MSGAREVLSEIPWDMVLRGAMAFGRMVQRARSIRHATRLVEAIERLAEVPQVDVDRIVAEVTGVVRADAAIEHTSQAQHDAEMERLRKLRADEPTKQHRVVPSGEPPDPES